MGPPGGDALVLAADPVSAQNLFLGTADGHIFGSTNGGDSWELLGRAGAPDTVITAILVDPRNSSTLFAAGWTRNGSGGAVFRSSDFGRTWGIIGLQGEAVRALAQAPSDPEILIAGTLDGVFRSLDAGLTWKRISPEGHEEIRNLDSVAIDPKNPDVVYVGTFHLPWKTADGGRTWRAIHDGMIDDSDVMSIAVDRTNPRRIFASACSGIYRSENAGAMWRKIQGIPYSARRTHVIVQHPTIPQTIYAATTEGLWKTADFGDTWKRMTPGNWVINSLVLDPRRPERVVIGTERLGVQLSEDSAQTFRESNSGFHHRQIVALALDRELPSRVLAVLANAPEPVLATEDGGMNWARLGPGLSTEALKRVYAAPTGWWAALERGGLMLYDAQKSAWVRAASLVGQAAATKDKKGNAIPAKGPRPFNLVVSDMAFSTSAWFAATPAGLLASRDGGTSWDIFPVGPMVLPVRSIRVSPDGARMWVVTLRGMAFSFDAGANWTWHDLAFDAGEALRLDVADEQTLVATARNGLYISRDGGKSFSQAASGLPVAPVQDLAVAGKVFLASMQSRGLYISYNQGQSWSRVEGMLSESFFPVISTSNSAETIFAASSTDGLFAVELVSQMSQMRTKD
jgi:photosystem II stability/assembly factor-like uncharacterized protein